MSKTKPIVTLAREQTHVGCGSTRRRDAITAAYNVTMSEHEHEWTKDQQRSMAEYVLWAHQRLSAIEQIVDGDLEHEPATIEGRCAVCGRVRGGP